MIQYSDSHNDQSIPRCNLYCADCFDIFPFIENKSIDAIIADLPYGVTQNENDIVLPFDKLWEQYNRIIKDNGAIILFGQGLFFIDLVNSNRDMFRYDLIWNKQLTTGFLNANRMPLRVHENIAVFYKKLPTYNPQFTQGKPMHSKGKSYLNKHHKNNNYGNFKMTDDERSGNTQKYRSKKSKKNYVFSVSSSCFNLSLLLRSVS